MTPKEITLAQERLHWGIFILPLLMVSFLLLLTLPVLVLIHMMTSMLGQLNPQSGRSAQNLFYLVVFLPEILVGLPFLLMVWIAYLKSNITLTNRRLIFRTGLVVRVAGELPLENVEAIFIVEPLLGRILGYGTVIVTSVGGLRFPLRYITSPQNFHATLQKAVTDAKSSDGSSSKPPARPAPDDDSRFMPKS
ncbi:MAG: PH domain-containing protein [Verrucomicrobiia bacterium]